MKYRVVLVPFPFDDLSAVKVRPAVCLTDAIGAHRHVVLAFITSQQPPDSLPTDVVIQAGTTGFGQTGLRVTSTVRLHRLMTASTRFISRELGELPDGLQQEVDRKLRELFRL